MPSKFGFRLCFRIASFCCHLPISKKSDLLFWITLNTSDHFHLKWLRVLLLLLPYHMQKTNFITQRILEIKLTICCHFEHVKACLTTPTWSSQLILSAFLDLLSYPKIQLHISSFFVRYCGLKNPAFWGFWIITQEPDFCKHVLAKSTKKHWHLVLK